MSHIKEICKNGILVVLSGGLNHLPYLLSTSVSLAVIKYFLTNYMTALVLNQAYTYIAKIKGIVKWEIFFFVKSWAIVPRGTAKKKICLRTFFGSVLTILFLSGDP